MVRGASLLCVAAFLGRLRPEDLENQPSCRAAMTGHCPTSTGLVAIDAALPSRADWKWTLSPATPQKSLRKVLFPRSASRGGTNVHFQSARLGSQNKELRLMCAIFSFSMRRR
jgi:hypothetical protein